MAENFPTYNLKAVIRETGLTPATLRAWERRYGLLNPHRSPGGHRLYTQNEIELLKWLMARQEEGLSISHAVELWRRQQEQVHATLPDSRSETTVAYGSTTLDSLRRAWISACMSFDEPAAEQALAHAFAIATAETVCIDVLLKGLAEIGEGWYAGRISIQQEHFASALAMRRLHALFAAAPRPTRPGRILAACPPGEAHEFSLLVLSYLLRRRGWDVVYLGVNVPLSQLDATIRRVAPHLVLSVAQTLDSAASLRDMANTALDQGVAMTYGGGIFNQITDLRTLIPGHFLGDTLANVPDAIEGLLLQPPALPEKQSSPPALQALLEIFTARSPHVVASVTAALQSYGIDPAHLEGANTNFTHALLAALKLGDLHILDHTVGWLEGLLENYGLPPTLAAEYYAACFQAVQQHLGAHANGRTARPLLEWLTQFAAVKE